MTSDFQERKARIEALMQEYEADVRAARAFIVEGLKRRRERAEQKAAGKEENAPW
jgi:hypothetical protein